jgi:hypothetical protein
MPSVQNLDSRWEAADRPWRPLATIEAPLELGMLKPLELDRDEPLDLVIGNSPMGREIASPEQRVHTAPGRGRVPLMRIIRSATPLLKGCRPAADPTRRSAQSLASD